MKIEMRDGQPTIDARDLARLLELDPAEVQVKMRAGKITSQFETGIDEDAGRMRLSFQYGGKRVRLTCSTEGVVLKTTRTDIGAR